MEGQGADGLRASVLGTVPVDHFPCQRERLLLYHGKCCWPSHVCHDLQAWPHPGHSLPESLLVSLPVGAGEPKLGTSTPNTTTNAEQRRGLTFLNLLAMLECLRKH